MSDNELIESAKQAMNDLASGGKMLEHEQSAYNCLRLFCDRFQPEKQPYLTVGQLEKAERIAMNIFDEWNEVSGVVLDLSGYYFEISAIIKEAVSIGAKMAIHGKLSITNKK